MRFHLEDLNSKHFNRIRQKMAKLILVALAAVFMIPLATAQGIGSCGVPSVQPALDNGITRIRGGREAIPHSWPWQVRVGVKTFMGVSVFCGGSIIDKDHILTAAHCFLQNFGFGATYFVRTGDHSMLVNEAGQKDYDVAKVITHKNFTMADEVKNDIAILRLKKSIVFSSTTKPVCLPANGSDAVVGNTCVVSGWGSTVNQSTGVYKRSSPVIDQWNVGRAAQPVIKASNVLKQAAMTIFDRNYCRLVWGDIIVDHMICTLDANLDHEPCQGDSGGPLVCLAEDEITWNLEGVVSFGAGCGMRAPAIFTRVGQFTSWIADNTVRA